MDVLIPGILSVNNQAYEIALVTIFISALSALVRKATVDFQKVKASREKMKEHQQAMKEAQKKGQTDRMLKAQEEYFKHYNEQMKQTFKPLLITLIPFLLIFGYLNTTYSDLHPLMNVTIVDHLPADAVLDNVKPSGDGNHSLEDHTVFWFVPKARTDSTSTVTIEADVKSGSFDELKNNKAQLTYVDRNGTLGPVVSTELPQQTAQMKLEKSAEYENGRVKYTLTYGNTASNNVVFFPLNTDLWIIHIHNGFDWFLWYFTFSLFVSIIINKLIGAS